MITFTSAPDRFVISIKTSCASPVGITTPREVYTLKKFINRKCYFFRHENLLFLCNRVSLVFRIFMFTAL